MNVSSQVALELDGYSGVIELGEAKGNYAAEERSSSIVIHSKVLPVDEAGSLDTTHRLEEEIPAAIIHLGLAENRKLVSVETLSVNSLEFKIPDNSGRKVESGRITDSGRDLLHSTAPINLIMAESDGDPRIVRSDDAGRFVCNEIYFRTLEAVEGAQIKDRHGRALPVVFVHLPPPEEIPFEEQVEIVRHIAGIVVQRPSVPVVGGLLRDSEGRLMAARRAPHEFMGGYWEFPGGKVESGESFEEAIVREFMEEFSWSIKPLSICERFSHAWPEMVVHLTFFVCEPDGELPDAVLTSHDEYRWLADEELDSVNWLPPDIEFVQRIMTIGASNL